MYAETAKAIKAGLYVDKQDIKTQLSYTTISVNNSGKFQLCKKEEIKYALRKLNRNGFIDIDTVQINHKEDIYKFIHDEDLYEKSKETIWNVVDTELVDEYKVTGTFNRITVNDAIIKCSDNKHNKVLLHVKGHLFFDKSINDNEIINEYWGD